MAAAGSRAVNRACYRPPHFFMMWIRWLNHDRFHVSLAISKHACFDASMLNLFPHLSFPPSLLQFCVLLANPLAPSVLRFMYIPAGLTFYLRHGARDVSDVGSSGSAAPASTPATSSDTSLIQLSTSSKSLIGMGAVVGTFLLGSYACTTGTGLDPPPSY
jgi:hypothetical protein